MSSFADDFRIYILENNLSNGVDVFVNYTPSKQDSISLFTTGGYDKDITLDAQNALEQPTIQIRARLSDSVKADAILRAINDFIQDKTNVVLGEYVYTLFSAQGDVLYISRDEDNRANFVLNLYALRMKNS